MIPIAIHDCTDSIAILGQVTVELEWTRRSNIVLALRQQYQKLSKNVPEDSGDWYNYTNDPVILNIVSNDLKLEIWN